MMRIGSLFSGIGGLELGLERAGLGRVVWQVEIDPDRRAVLARHWPTAARFSDVRLVSACRHVSVTDNALNYVEVICGGFPCQDLSDASRGRGGGLDGRRSGLWRELIRIVDEIEPKIVVVENVGGAAARKWLPALRRTLHVLGYRTRAIRVDAADVGAPHARARVFVVGYADAKAQPAGALDVEVAGLRTFATLGRHWRESKPSTLRMADGILGGLDARRLEMLGDAVVPDMAELVGRVVLHDIRNEARP